MVNSTMMMAGAVALAMGGLAFVFLGGDSRAEKRLQNIGKVDKKTRAATIDRTAKKKQI